MVWWSVEMVASAQPLLENRSSEIYVWRLINGCSCQKNRNSCLVRLFNVETMSTTEYSVKEKKCFHCGDKLDSTPYILDDHNFCCLGCQTVYQVLNESNLHNYYRYNQHPGK